jgi:NAD-dependent DNA ligase
MTVKSNPTAVGSQELRITKMSNLFAKQGAEYQNDLNRSLGALIGIAQGLICDNELNDNEIDFLNKWLESNDVISNSFPGDVLYSRIQSIIADGVITDDERTHLIDTLQQLVGGALSELADNTHVSSLAVDNVNEISFEGKRFVLTGDFVFGSEMLCRELTERFGGTVSDTTSKKIDYVVVGGLGSKKWKYGSFGNKIKDAMQLKSEGSLILIIHENCWANSFPVNVK